jgi:hypothetical protein
MVHFSAKGVIYVQWALRLDIDLYRQCEAVVDHKHPAIQSKPPNNVTRPSVIDLVIDDVVHVSKHPMQITQELPDD